MGLDGQRPRTLEDPLPLTHTCKRWTPASALPPAPQPHAPERAGGLLLGMLPSRGTSPHRGVPGSSLSCPSSGSARFRKKAKARLRRLHMSPSPQLARGPQQKTTRPPGSQHPQVKRTELSQPLWGVNKTLVTSPTETQRHRITTGVREFEGNGWLPSPEGRAFQGYRVLGPANEDAASGHVSLMPSRRQGWGNHRPSHQNGGNQ